MKPIVKRILIGVGGLFGAVVVGGALFVGFHIHRFNSSMAKVLDRFDLLPLDQARRIDHKNPEVGPAPSPTKEYGRFLAKGCTGCHGEKLSGGPIPGAPPEIPVPLNITPDATGLQGWSYEDFDRLLATGVKKNGKKFDPFMPISGIGKMDETEKKALWAHLSGLAPLPFGGR